MKRTTPLILAMSVLLVLSAVAFAASSAPAARSATSAPVFAQTTQDYTLWGDTSLGWGSTSTSIMTPGPTLTVTQGVKVNLTLFSHDNVAHSFCVDLDRDGACTGGDIVSGDFSSNTTAFPFSFTPTTAGSFTYWCSIHFGPMKGTINIQSTGGAGTDYTPYIIVIVLIVVVAVAIAVVMRRKPKGPAQPPQTP